MRTRPRQLCWDAVRSEWCGLSRDRLPPAEEARTARSSAWPQPVSFACDGARGYRLRIRRWEVGLEIEIERSELQLRLQLQHDVPLVVRKPHLGVSVLGKNSLGLDNRLDDDRIESSGWDLHCFPANYLDAHRIAIRTEVTVKVISLAHLERNRAQEVQERSVIERLTDGFLLFRWLLRGLNEDRPFRIDLEPALGILSALLELLHETQRRQRLRIHPALVDVVYAIQEISALDPEGRMPGGAAAQVVECDDFHMRGADAKRAEPDLVLHAFACSERNLGLLYRRRDNGLRGRCRNCLRPGRAGAHSREGSDVRDNRQAHQVAPPVLEVAARSRALRLKRKRFSASAIGRTRVSRVRTSYRGARSTFSTLRAKRRAFSSSSMLAAHPLLVTAGLSPSAFNSSRNT